MNQVYSYEFACACLDAGITYGFFFSSIPEQDIVRLVDRYGSNKLYAAMPLYHEDNIVKTIKTVIDTGIKNIEFLVIYTDNDKSLKSICPHLISQGYEIYAKREPKFIQYLTGVVVKGNEAAARSSENDLFTEFNQFKKEYPNKKVIASGGIYSGLQVKQYIDLGASAVAVGTLLAASEESPLSDAAKQKILASNSKNLTRFSNSQQSLVFSDFNHTDENHTASLRAGMDTGTQGHLFLGHAIDHITDIKPVADIVAELSSHLV